MRVEFSFTPERKAKLTDVIEFDDDVFDNMSDEQRDAYLQKMALEWAADFYGVGFRIIQE